MHTISLSECLLCASDTHCSVNFFSLTFEVLLTGDFAGWICFPKGTQMKNMDVSYIRIVLFSSVI